jgi:hypothetical protein
LDEVVFQKDHLLQNLAHVECRVHDREYLARCIANRRRKRYV